MPKTVKKVAPKKVLKGEQVWGVWKNKGTGRLIEAPTEAAAIEKCKQQHKWTPVKVNHVGPVRKAHK